MRILVTDDATSIQAIYAIVLSQFKSIVVDFADTVDSSRAKFATNDYDMAFFDQDLDRTDVSGQDLVHEFKKINKHAKVYMATSHCEPRFLSKCKNAGTDVIEKGTDFIQSLRLAVQS